MAKKSVQSGVETNGDKGEKRPKAPLWTIPTSWCWTTVDKVGTARLGRQRSPGTESAEFPTKYLRTANITASGLDLSEVLEMDFNPNERQTYALQAGDLVLADASGSAAQVGRAAIWSGEIPGCCFQNHVIRFRPHATVSEYALLVFRHLAITGAFAAVARGVGIQHLGLSTFAQLPFPLPPLSEQERISQEANRQLRQVVDARDSIESALHRTDLQDNIVLEAAALGGLIDPIKGKTVVLPPKQKADQQPELFSAQDEDNRVPDSESTDLMGRALPSGWKWIRVDQAGEVRLGRQRSPEHEYGDNMVPYLRVANVHEDRIDTKDIRSMNFTPHEQEIFRLISGDILLNEGQSPELVGRPAMYTGEPPNMYFQNSLVRFRAGPHVNPRFALLVFRYYLRFAHFTRTARWSTNIAHLGAERVAAMPFPLPPREEQNNIVAEANRRLEASKIQRTSMESSLQRMDDMRRTIIHSAVTGAMVPQISTDESAENLLARLGPPPDPKPETKGKERRMPRRTKSTAQSKKPLYETLVGLKKAVLPDLLFRAAGYDPDSVADVENFYLALREELGSRIQQQTDDAGIHLEVITDAA